MATRPTDLEVDIHSGQRELMYSGISSLVRFGGQDARHPRWPEHRPWAAGGDEFDDIGARPQHARGDGDALCGVLPGHVDHVRRAGLIQVRKPVPARFGHRYLLTTVTAWTYGISSAGSGNVSSPKGDDAPVRSDASSLTA
jgi:hypothetical protein